MIALNNCLRRDYCDSVFVLQENDPGEIDWDIFSMPELKNFLLILDREEASYKREIHEKYEIIHKHMKTLAEQKKSEWYDTNVSIAGCELINYYYNLLIIHTVEKKWRNVTAKP